MAATSNVAFYWAKHRGTMPAFTVEINGAEHIWEGQLLFRDSDGYGTHTAGGNPFLGVPVAEVDNSGGGDGAKSVEVANGVYKHFTASGLSQSDVGKDIFASDSNTLTLTASGNSRVGKIVEFISATECAFMSQGLRLLTFDMVYGLIVSDFATSDATFSIDNIEVMAGDDPRTTAGSATETLTIQNKFSWEGTANDAAMAKYNQDAEQWYAVQVEC